MAPQSEAVAANVNVTTKTADSKDYIKWAITFLLPALFFFLPLGLEQNQKLFIVFTLWAVTAWVTDIFPNEAVGMVLPTLYVIFNVAPANVVFAPWSNSMIWMTLGAMVMGSVMIATGLSQRIAYWCILRVGGGLKGLMWGLGLAGIVLALLVPANLGRLSIMVPLAVGICQALDIKPKSRDASAVMLATFFAVCAPALGVLTGAGQNLLANAVFGQAMGYQVTWVNWAIHNFIPSIVWTVISLAITIWVLKPGADGNTSPRAEVERKYHEMGTVKSSEYKILGVVTLIILAFLTQKWHGLDVNWFFTLIIPLYFMPGFKMMKNDEFMKMNVMIIFFVAGAMSIGAVCDAVGLSKLFAAKLAPLVTGSDFKMIFGVGVIGAFLNFLLTPLAMVATFTGLFAQMALNAGIAPEAVMYSFLYGADIYIFPYEFAFLLFVCSYGYLSIKDIVKVMIPRSIACIAFLAVVAYPFWKLIGLL